MSGADALDAADAVKRRRERRKGSILRSADIRMGLALCFLPPRLLGSPPHDLAHCVCPSRCRVHRSP